ncbi:MAG TPA: cytochrome C oxidase subunit IV family protein [Dehalococcoidia bacterium]|nr:cytochrome C oxidase subunit IV family protein [Dehalococcoidia bacterium]
MNRDGHHRLESPAATRQTNPVVLGIVVFALLMVLTVLEYFVFLWLDRNLPLMIAMNVADAALIMVYFMHLPRVWRGREDH